MLAAGRIWAVPLLLFWAITCRGQNASSSGSASSSTSGFATEYGGKGDGQDPNNATFGVVNGACGYGAFDLSMWPFWSVAAISSKNPVAGSSAMKGGCGACIKVTCTGSGCKFPSASIIVLVTDSCDDCAANQINVHARIFEQKLANTGRVDVTFQQVACQPDGGVVVKVTSYKAPSSGGYVKLALLGVPGRDAVSSVDIRSQGVGSWQIMNNSYGATWQASSTPNPPYDIRYAVGGNTYVLPGVITKGSTGDFASNGTGSPVGSAVSPAGSVPDSMAVGQAGGPVAGSPVTLTYPPGYLDALAASGAPQMGPGGSLDINGSLVATGYTGGPRRRPAFPSGGPSASVTLSRQDYVRPAAADGFSTGPAQTGLQIKSTPGGGIVSWLGDAPAGAASEQPPQGPLTRVAPVGSPSLGV